MEFLFFSTKSEVVGMKKFGTACCIIFFLLLLHISDGLFISPDAATTPQKNDDQFYSSILSSHNLSHKHDYVRRNSYGDLSELNWSCEMISVITFE